MGLQTKCPGSAHSGLLRQEKRKRKRIRPSSASSSLSRHRRGLTELPRLVPISIRPDGRERAMATRYLIISLPVQGGATAGSLWSRLQDSISRHSFDTPLYRVKSLLCLSFYSPLRFAATFSPDLLGLRSSTSQISAWAPSIRSWPSATISSRFTLPLPRPRSRSLLASICCDTVAICAVQCLRGGRLAQDPKADRGSRARRRGRERGTHRRWRPRRHLPHQVLPSSLTY
jgi:hypothetical protein